MKYYEVAALQNSSNFAGNLEPTIKITKNDPNWDEAYSKWVSGKTPTDSPEWKKGVFAIMESIK